MIKYKPSAPTVCKEIYATSSSHGFSLVELLVIIAIIAIIAGISLPNLLSMRAKSSVRADARDVHSTLRLAQTLAVKEGIDVCFRVSGNAYGLYDYFTGKALSIYRSLAALCISIRVRVLAKKKSYPAASESVLGHVLEEFFQSFKPYIAYHYIYGLTPALFGADRIN